VPTQPSERPPYVNFLAAAAFGLIALAYHLWGLDAKSLWGDEASTAWHSTYSVFELWTQPITHKPPLYYWLTQLFWSPGNGEFALRLPAALLGAAVVALCWPVGLLLGGRGTAFWLSLFTLLSDIHLHYSQEARHYILLTLGWVLLLLAMLRLLRHPATPLTNRIGDLALWTVAALLMVHAHPVGLLYLAASQLAFWFGLLAARPVGWRIGLATSLLTLAATLTLLPWMHVALINAAGSFNWLQQPSAQQALIQWSSLFGARNLALLGGVPLALWGGVMLTLISLGGLLVWLRRDRAVAVALLGLMILPPLTLWLTGFIKPVYMPRTIMPSHLLAMTGLALAVSALGARRWRITAGLALALVLATAAWAWRVGYQKEAWHDLATELQRRGRPDDIALVCENQLYRPLWFYLGDDMPRLLYLDRRKRRLWIWRPDLRRWRPFHPAPGEAPPQTFWLIDRLGHCPRQMDRILPFFTGRRYQPGPQWHGHALTLTPWREAGSLNRSPR